MFGVLGNGWARALEGAMPLSWMRTKFAEFRSQALGELANELELELSEDLVEALAAATSMVAFADGVASPEEREELLSVFEEEERLTNIDLDDLFDAFDDYAERFAEDTKAAEGEALAAVGALDDSPDLGRLVVRAALAIDLFEDPPYDAAPLDLAGRSRVVAAGTPQLCAVLADALA